MPSLEAVLGDIERESIEAIVVRGDTISGPCATEVFDLVLNLGAVVVRGHSEYDVEACVAAIEVMGAPADEQLLDDLLKPPESVGTTERLESLRGA